MCTLTLIRLAINTDTWKQVDFPSGDVTVITLEEDWGKLMLSNAYIEGNSNNTITQLKHFYRSHPDIVKNLVTGIVHTMWVGDFYRHHKHWDNHNDTCLFTVEATAASEYLIDAAAALGLEMTLPSGIPIHLYNVIKKWSKLDQVFISDHFTDLIEFCDIET